jgi:hypothetical protein
LFILGFAQNEKVDDRKESHWCYDMRPRKELVTRSNFGQNLLVNQMNYTLTNYAEQSEEFSPTWQIGIWREIKSAAS